MEGQYYFTLKGAEWMVPVSEDDYYNARDLSGTLAKVSFVLTWAVTLASVGYGAYLYMFLERPFYYFLGAWMAGFVVAFLINLYPQNIPTMGMWQQLRAAQQLDDETKAKLLVRRAELI